MTCSSCGNETELRFGVCYDCATSAEERASKRTVLQHVARAFREAARGERDYFRYCMRWAWQRATRTGDYADGGYFDDMGYRWRN